MLRINTFSIHDLLGFLLLAGPAIIFYLSYWRLGRARIDLLFANLLTICSLCCLIMFLEDNIVPQGMPSVDVPGAAAQSFWLVRLLYASSIVWLLASIRFTHVFTNTHNVLTRNALLTYVFLFPLTAIVFLPAFLQQRMAPLGFTSDWKHAMPWFPKVGPLAVVYLVAWLATQAYCQWLFHRHIQSLREAPDRIRRRANAVRLAFLVQVAGVMADVTSTFLGYVGIGVFPITSIVTAVLIARSILRDRIDSERSQQRLAQELDLASRIQSRLLPMPARGVCGFELVGWNQQAEQVGGDLYDYLCMPDGRWLILLADASGHGMGPALQVAQTRAALRAAAMQSPRDPAQVLQVANSLLSQDVQDGSFVTCFVGFLDPLRRTMQYASAGHGPIIFYDRGRNTFDTFSATATPLGVLGDEEFSPEVLERRFSSGDFVLVISDGIWEAANAGGNQFGIDRVVDLLRDHLAENPGSILTALRESLAAFTGRQQCDDDLTAVFLRRRVAECGALA